MKTRLKHIAQVAEIIAAAAIVVSLLFVGFQIRENARVAKLQLTKDVLFQSMDIGTAIVSDTAIRETFSELRGFGADGTQADEFAYFVSIFRFFELIYNLRDENLIDDDVWNSYAIVFGQWIAADRVWQLWQVNEAIFEPQFRAYIRSLRE
jgi:hypothetical protein